MPSHDKFHDLINEIIQKLAGQVDLKKLSCSGHR